MKVNLNGWWECFNCFMMVNAVVNGNECPDFDCGHRRCKNCKGYVAAAGTRTPSPQTVAMESKNFDILHHEEEFEGDHAAKAASPRFRGAIIMSAS